MLWDDELNSFLGSIIKNMLINLNYTNPNV